MIFVSHFNSLDQDRQHRRGLDGCLAGANRGMYRDKGFKNRKNHVTLLVHSRKLGRPSQITKAFWYNIREQ